MASYTPNYNLYLPSRNDSTIEVDTSLSNNFSEIDTAIKNNASQLYSIALNVKYPFGTNLTPAKGDGVTDDTTAIQNAYNSLTNGGILFFPQGTYKVTQTLNFNLSNVNILGVGQSSVIAILSNQQADGTRIHINNCSNFFIRDIFVKETNATLSRSNVYGTFGLDNVTNGYFENVQVNGANGVGIHGMNSQDITFFKCTVMNTMADGIHFQRGSKNVKIINCTVTNTQDDCISFVSHNYSVNGNCDGYEAYGNTLGYTSVTGSGICCDGSLNVKLHDNKINNVQLAGIRINPITDNGTAYPANIEVYDNTIDTTGIANTSDKSGIAISQSNNVKVKDNIIRNAVGGIYTTGCEGEIIVEDNSLYNTNGRVVWVSTQTTKNTYAKVYANENKSRLSQYDGVYVDCSSLKADVISVKHNNFTKLNNSNSANVFGANLSNASMVIYEENILSSDNTISNSISGDQIFRKGNIPLDVNDNNFIGTAKHSYAGSAPTAGTHNAGEIVWNWNPSSGVLCWVCTATGTPGTWSAININ